MISGATVLTLISHIPPSPGDAYKWPPAGGDCHFLWSPAPFPHKYQVIWFLHSLTTAREPPNESNYQKVTSLGRSQRRRKTTICPHTGFLNTFCLKEKCTRDHWGDDDNRGESSTSSLPSKHCVLSTFALSVASSKLFECFSLVKIIMMILG